ncbi:MAG: type I-E CRISPR-associated protein Cas6/Cse3/CasE [Patescibacteria group bacterium]|nr:type I-E CRISPR-associated protein Cas6/Cse3/CasE [Patescibacteria group bacterium]
MFLHRIHLNPRCREARRDLADCYQLHSTLCRAFCDPEQKCPPGQFLWRLEPETDACGSPRVLVQGRCRADWSRIGVEGWIAGPPDRPIDLAERLALDSLQPGRRFRFRLRANPSVCRDGRRLGLFRTDEQEAWLQRKGCQQHGFSLRPLTAGGQDPSAVERFDVQISQEQMLRGSRRGGGKIVVFSVLYDGILTVTDPLLFRRTLLGGTWQEGDRSNGITMGIGHGRAMGLGLLSVVPLP